MLTGLVPPVHVAPRRARPLSGQNMLSATACRCILTVLRASACGSGPGCPPFGGGTGFCASGASLDHLEQRWRGQRRPPAARTVRPRDGVRYPQEGFLAAHPVVERKR